MMQVTAYSQTADQSQWGVYYLQSVNRQMECVISLIINNKERLEFLAQQYDSMLTVFEQSAHYPGSNRYSQLFQFACALHPLPIWWGKWTEWLQVLNKTSRAMEKKGNLEQQAWLYLAESEMLISAGDGRRSLELSTKAIQLATPGFPELQFRAELAVSEANNFLGNLTNKLASIAILETSLREKKNRLPESTYHRLTAQLLLKMADTLRRQGFLEKAMNLVNRALCLAKEYAGHDKLFKAELYSQRNYTLWACGELDKTIKDLKRATVLYKEIGNQTTQIDCQGDFGLTYWSALQYDEAEQTLRESIYTAEKIRVLWWQAIQTGNVGLVILTRGRLPKALALIEQHYALSKLTNNQAEIERANGNIGIVNIFMGKFQEAHQRLTQNLKYAENRKLFIAKGVGLANLAWAHLMMLWHL